MSWLLATSANADITNSATATGTDTSGQVTSNTSVVAVPLTPQSPSIAIVKNFDQIVDTNTNGYQDAGDTITYNLVVTNTGNVSLNNVTVTDNDSDVTVSGSPIATMLPGTTANLTAIYVIEAANMFAGFYENTATVTGTPTVGGAVSDFSDPLSTTSDGPTRVSLIPPSEVTLDKSASITDVNGNGITDAGDQINYTFNVTNSGAAALTNLTVTDPSITLIGSPIAILAPGISNNTAYSGTHILTQEDVDAGQYVNTAQVDATTPSNATITDTDIETTLITRTSGIALIKTATPNFGASGIANAGDTISYQFTVANIGNTTLTNISIYDTGATVSSGPLATLLPGASDSSTFTATHTLTQAEIDTGTFSNQATANASSPTGPVEDLSDDDDNIGNDRTIVALPVPKVAMLMNVVDVVDNNGNGRQDAGDTVIYGYSITNTGNIPLTAVTVNNSQVTLSGAPIATLAPGETNTTAYTSTYVLTVADADAGFFDNQADVGGTTLANGPVADISHPTGITSDGPTRVTVEPYAELTLVKALAGPAVDVDNNGTIDEGDRIDYQFLVTNKGSVTVSNIVLADPSATVSGGPISLAPDASDATSFTARHTLTQADIDAGRFINTATVNGRTPGGNTVTASDDETAAYTVSSSLTLDKTAVLNAGPDGIANVGETVTYTFNVTNTGVTTLRNVRIDDPLLSASNITSSPQAMTNLALAQTGVDPITTATVAPVDQAVKALRYEFPQMSFTPSRSAPSVAAALHVERDPVLMKGDSNAPKAGDEVGIVFRISNAGEAPLTTITAEQAGTKVFAEKLDVLANNQTDVGSILLLHVLTAEEAASGKIMTPARVTARSRNETITVDLQDPILLADIASFDEIATAAITPSNAPTLAPGQTFTFTATHVLTQANIDAGVLDNTATALGTGHNGDVSNTDSATTPLPAQPSITLVKVATPNLGADGIANVGDTITYAFTVENSGNVTLNSVTINDPKVAVIGTLTSLAPQAVDLTTFSATYTLTQADIDAARFENQATVSGTPPAGAAVTDVSDDNDTAGSDPTVVAIAQTPGIAITKNFVSFNDLNGNGITDLADTATFNFTVTNTGNVSLSNVTVIDPIATVTGGPITLTPAAVDSTTFTATVAIDQPMLDAGEIRNQATVEGNPPTGPPVTDLSHPTDPKADGETVTEVPQQPAISLVKTVSSVTDVNNSGLNDLGDIINYAFTITNTGNVTLNNVVLSDNNAVISGGPITLAPGASNTTNYTGRHVIVTSDVAVGQVVNQATVTGDSLRAGAVSDASDSIDPNGDAPTVTEVATNPGIAVVKTVVSITDTPGSGRTVPSSNGSGALDEGDIITYAITVTNTGDANLSNVTLTELLPDAVLSGGTIPSLLVNASDSTTFTATYTIKQADVDAGRVDNQVRAQALAPGNQAVTDLSDDTSPTENEPTVTTINNRATVALLKTVVGPPADVNGNGFTDAGDIINYAFAVHNTGNVPLLNLTVTDTKAVVVGAPINLLAVGAVNTTAFTASHVLTQAEVEAGRYENQATVSATATTQISPVTDLSDDNSLTENGVTSLTIVAVPRIALVKTVAGTPTDINGNGFTDAGDIINYAFAVHNTGNVPLSNVTIADTKAVVVGGPINTLAVGTVNNTAFTASHVLTQADIDARMYENQATVSATSPTQPSPVTDISDDNSITGNDPTNLALVPVPRIALVKTVVGTPTDVNGNGLSDVGDVINYAFAVHNTGNVPLSNVTISDTKAVVIGGPINTLAVGAVDSTAFTASHVLTLADVEAGRYENQATVSATSPTQTAPVTDLSDDSSVSENDPTDMALVAAPRIALIKTVAGTKPTDVNSNRLVDAGDVINYAFAVHNLGNVPLFNVTIADTKAVVAGGPIEELKIGAVNVTTFTARHVLTQADIDAGKYENQATVSATATTQTAPVTDLSDDGALAENDVTSLAIVATPRIALVKTIKDVTDENGNGIHDVGDIINYAFTVTNTGNVSISKIVVTDKNAVMAGQLLEPLAAGESNSTAFTATHNITVAEGTAGLVSNQAEVSGLSPTSVAVRDDSDDNSLTENDATIINVVLTPPNLTKTALRSQVSRGDIVPYTIRATNVQGDTFYIRDIMPPGFQYVTGSARANGVAITPAISGQTLTFNPLTRDEKTSSIEIKLKLIAAVTSKTGKFVNKAEIIDTNSGNVAGRAEATVTIKEEHVFDCSDIIGRVFDDLNGNGYADDGEPGLPGVRLVTVNGRIITTDDKGRFSVPCADVPKDNIGANYILKLDPKSLPAGYQLTTENPRMVRVTPGKVVKLNFGAQGTRNVQLDIRKDAFIGNGIGLAPKWVTGLDRLVTILKKSKGNLDIVYRCGVYAPIADQRLEALEEAIKAKWEEEGSPHKLKINSRVECGK